jgi:hypothetical protein
MLPLKEYEPEVFQERFESRFMVSPEDLTVIKLDLMKSGFEPIRYSDNAIRNIHFTSPELRSPRNGYIRLRKYVPSEQLSESPFTLDSHEVWYLEIKPKSKSKVRISVNTEIALQLLNEQRDKLFKVIPVSADLLSGFDSTLVAIASSQWKRTHFISSDSLIRVTIDEMMGYFGFKPGDSTAIFMGRQEQSKLEVKMSLERPNENEVVRNLTLSFGKPVPDNWQEKEMRRRYALMFSE